jgi:hypothetical protein
MGLFNRKNDRRVSSIEPDPIGTERSKFSQSDLDVANQLMTRFQDVRGNGSDQDLAEVLEQFGVLGGGRLAQGWNRPWLWWTELAQWANELGDHGLAFKIFWFSVDYTKSIGPKLPNAFSLGVGYGTIDAAAHKALASIGLESLKVMQAERPDIDFSPEIAEAQRILAT